MGRPEPPADRGSHGVIEHHGVKGMRWGVRKDRTRQDQGHQGQKVSAKKIKKLDKKFENVPRNSYKLRFDIHNEAAAMTNKNDVSRINNKPQYRNADFSKESPLRRRYYAEHQAAYIKNLETVAASKGTNASGTRKYTIHERPDGNWDVTTVDVKHADGVDTMTVHVTYDSKKKIVKVGVPSTVQQADDFVDDFLQHFGVKGMKWGVHRREQAGSVGGRDVTITSKGGSRVKTSGGRGHGPSEDALSAARSRQIARRSSTDSLSTKDLQNLVTRMNLERQYGQLKSHDSTVNAGMETAKKILAFGALANTAVLFAKSPAGQGVKLGIKKALAAAA